MEFAHYSVLLKEAIDGLSVKPDGIYVDGTLGGGGHSLEIAKQLSQGGQLYGLDRDEDAIAAATKRLTDFADRITLVRSNYGDLRNVLLKENIEAVDGILLDLGVSSYQLDNEERGFSYRFDAPLDMRMDRRQTLTAREIVNDYPEDELFRVIRDYGEERFAKSIARQIVKRRSVRPLNTTYDLNEAIAAAIPAKMRSTGGHPSKRTFQAIRIECNGELSVLSDSVDGMIGLLKPKGRLCIITFHSLEDRIVKNAMKRAENPCTCPPSFPICVCGNVSKGTVITKKPILPGEQELNENSRSKSAKLRIFERGAL